jgi:hypothetical protein
MRIKEAILNSVLLETDILKMKKIVLLIMVIAIAVAFNEQISKEKNVYIMVGAILVFMFGMMRLSAKTPSKNQDKKEEHDN